MIRLPGNSNGNLPSPWRKRISNQLAAFAAIMLFASTQVSPTQPQGHAGAPEMATAGNEQSLVLDGTIAAKVTEELAEGADAMQGATGPKKDKRFKLSIFLLRR